MRFHIGFSKFLKPSQVIKWLGVGFVGFLTWFGLTQQQVLASSTFTNVDLSSYITSSPYVSKGTRKTGSSQPLNTPYEDSSSITFNQTSNNYAFLDNQNLLANGSYWRVMDETYYSINTNMCSSVTDTNSLDLWFQVIGRSLTYINDGLSNTNFTQAENYDDLQSIGVEPIYQDSGNGPPVVYACHIGEYTQGSNNSTWGYYDITCIGLPTEDVLGYKIHIYNNFYKNYEVSQLNVSGSYSFQGIFEIPKKYDYQCSYVEPTTPDNPIFPTDAIGSSTITIDTDNTDSSMGSSGGVNFDASSYDISFVNTLDFPQTIINFMELPFRIVQVVLDDNNTCRPLQLDFSSISSSYGGSDNFSINLPCMRPILTDLLDYQVFNNFTLYQLIDVILAFSLVIFLGSNIYHTITTVLSGEDLTDYIPKKR